MLADFLRKKGFGDVIETREPTDGVHGREIRRMAREGRLASPQAELDLFVLDRKEHVETLIKPSLEQGKIVLTDRYYFSSAAYQGARGLDVQSILELHETFAPLPDMLFIIDLPVEEALRRIQIKRGDSLDFFETKENLVKCREIFLGFKQGIQLDGMLSRDELHRQIVERVLSVLPKEQGF